jgi:cephalosporin hydroxylase
MNYTILANTAALTTGGLLQIPNELIPFMEYVDKEVAPKNFLELGLCNGGTFYIWCGIAVRGGIKLGIDLPNGNWGAPHIRSEKEIETNKHAFQTFAPNAYVLFDDTKEKNSIDWVKNKLNGEELDFLFIDADHSYEGVKTDFYNYLPFVRKGGFIAMHDIKKTLKHSDNGCHVYKFWEELEGEKKEFVDADYDWGGIGIIKV